MSQEQLRDALQRVRDRFFPESQPERDRDVLWQLVNDALATQPEQAKDSEVDELVSLLAACRDIAARLAPGVADDLLMQAVGGPSEVPAYIEGVISELTHPAPAASVSDDDIRKAFIANGFTIKDGHTDLKPYVYAAARAILALRPAQAGDKWREAIEERFAVNHITMPEDPREAIKKLIATEVRDALDPSISSAAAALVQAGVAMTAARKDAVFQASIEFIGTLTGMTPPPIEVAPPEVFAPFRDFTNKVCAIFENAAAPNKEGGA